MESIVQAFRFKDLQTALILEDWLKENDKTFEDLRNYVKEVTKSKKTQNRTTELMRKIQFEIAPKCKDCGASMRLYAGDEESCYWDCRKCGWSFLVNRSRKEEIERFNEEVQKRLEKEQANGLSNDGE